MNTNNQNNGIITNANNISYQNNNSNMININGTNNQLKLNSSINNGLNTIGKGKNLKSLSSGTLIPSSRSKKFNKVIKNGEKIRNIDINDDSEDIKNEDTESVSTNSNPIKRNDLNISKDRYFGNDTQKKLTSALETQNIETISGRQLLGPATTQIAKPPVKMNIFATFINKILDAINPNINKRQNELYQRNNYNNYHNQVMEPKSYVGELSSEITDKNSQTKSLYNQIKNIEIKKTNNNNNNLNNEKSKTLTKSNTFKKSNQKELLNQSQKDSVQIQKRLKKNPTVNSIDSNISSNLPLSNNILEKTSINNEPKTNLNDKNSQSTIKKEDDKKSKKSESKSSVSKFPFQPLTEIMNSPKRKLSSNISFPTDNKYIGRPQADTYLISHLGEHLQNEAQPLPFLEDIKNKGFRFCSELTQAGKEASGALKTDQDTPLISLSVGKIIGFNIFGVLDGHGLHGHFVSQFFKDYFVKNMINYTEMLKLRGIMTAEEIYKELKKTGFSYINELFNKADMELTKQNIFDYTISGTTCNLIFQFKKHLICFSVGDSRCIIVYDKGDFTNQGILPLSTDHKPNLPGEIERIQLSGGEVDTMRDMYGNRIGPARVYKRGLDYPGLAMSRSLGDFQAKQVGVISSPQIVEYDINSSTKFLVVCSDGVWEFASNEQVRDIGNIFYARNDAASFCVELVKYAMILWEQFDIIRDDITVVSVFF